MVFRERTYSVLIVSSSGKFNDFIRPLLPGTDYWPVEAASDCGSARRLILEREFDLVLINSPLKDEFGTQLSIDICSGSDTGVLLFIRNDTFEEIDAKVSEQGVCTIQKPVNSAVVAQSLRMLCAQRERLRRKQETQNRVEDKIAEIRLINKAKWILIEQKQMSESEAHHYLEKQAMDLRLSKKEEAEQIIRIFGNM